MEIRGALFNFSFVIRWRRWAHLNSEGVVRRARHGSAMCGISSSGTFCTRTRLIQSDIETPVSGVLQYFYLQFVILSMQYEMAEEKTEKIQIVELHNSSANDLQLLNLHDQIITQAHDSTG